MSDESRTDLDLPPQPSSPETGSTYCRHCGYNLHGFRVDEHCPECNKPVWESNTPASTSGRAITALILALLGVQPSYTLMASIVMLVGMGAWGIGGISYYIFPVIVMFILGMLSLIFSSLAMHQLNDKTRAGFTREFVITARILGGVELSIAAIFLLLAFNPY